MKDLIDTGTNDYNIQSAMCKFFPADPLKVRSVAVDLSDNLTSTTESALTFQLFAYSIIDTMTHHFLYITARRVQTYEFASLLGISQRKELRGIIDSIDWEPIFAKH